MTAAVDDAPLLQKDIGSVIVSAASAVGDTSSLLTGIHYHPTASTHVRESLPRSDDTMAAVATSALLQNKGHTSSGGSKNVDVDVGLLPISEHRLDSVQEESLLGVDDAMTAVVTSALLHKNDRNSSTDSRATTTIGSGSGDGVTGDVEMDVGMLQTNRRLISVGEDCDACASRPEISQTDFYNLVNSCTANASVCPDNVPIGCWDTSEVTDMAS